LGPAQRAAAEPGQARKGAAVGGYVRVPRINLAGAHDLMAAGGSASRLDARAI